MIHHSTESLPKQPMAASAASDDTGPYLDWYKDVVIYQLHVRSFYDSNGDGIGDFPGLTEKLEYVASLGVTAVWLLPFYPSPLRDEGYDIADYSTVNPTYGTLDDFKTFLEAAHRLGLRVITEMVINHTSDQHAWFQRARRAPKGSPEREFYVWSDTPDRFPEVRVIFQDFETSNWAWDSIAQQYYWHRFYSHQPDLNFDNPKVRESILEIVDFWFGLGVDGMRLDAIPYLYERDGTNCESLPETHAFLKELRRHIDEEFPGKMLLAEANQWPDETAAFFGADDECHMCFNFPLMPRLFMALQQEERFPVVDILRHTPDPPPSSQWAIFLRNHDELTLEMVTEEERDAMYRFYATDPQSRVNVGLRRRLAPLLRNDRRKLELMHALLLSLPGTPVMYYGDEIRMGDNIYLRDRDSVRTPMQWSTDRNAGFSRSNTQRLFLPIVVDPEFHYQSLNVETEEQNPHSFLWWLRRVLRLRSHYPAFRRGDIQFLFPQNPRIIAYLRRRDDEIILVLANLSRMSQYVELDLNEYRGRTPIELFGRTRFPMIGDLPYMLTLGPYGFYWFRLDWPRGEEERRAPADLPVVRVAADWRDAFRRPAVDRTCDALRDHLEHQAWHLSPERTLRAVEVRDVVPLEGRDEDGASYVVLIVRAHYAEGEPALYQLTFVVAGENRAHTILHDRPTAGALRITVAKTGESWFLCDATAERGFWDRVRSAMTDGAANGRDQGRIERHWAEGVELLPPSSDATHGSPTQRTSSSRGTVAVLDNTLFVKLFRRIELGIQPEIEMTTALAPHADTLPCPQLRGWWDYQRPDVGTIALGVVYAFIPHERSLADWCREDLARNFEIAAAIQDHKSDGASASHALVPNAELPTPPATAPAQRIFTLLGRRLAEVHAALVDFEEPPAFVPEVFTTHYRRSLHFGFRSEANRALEQLREFVRRSESGRVIGPELEFLRNDKQIERCFGALLRSRTLLWRIRGHGALGTREVLLQGDDLQFVDWGGDPGRPFSERRIKRSAFDDLARLELAVRLTARNAAQKWPSQTKLTEDGIDRICVAADLWLKVGLSEFLASYRKGVEGSLLVPDDDAEFAELFDAFRLDTAIEGLLHALRNPDHDRVAQAVAVCNDILSQAAAASSSH